MINALEEELTPILFPKTDPKIDPRVCPTCAEGRINLRLGKFGAFVGCSRYPDCKYTRPVLSGDAGDAPVAALGTAPKAIGKDPATGMPVTLRIGPYGPYLQLGPKEGAAAAPAEKPEEKAPEKGAEKGKAKKAKKPVAEKPKRAPIPKGIDQETITLDKAIALLSLPREVGKHPETGEVIKAGIGRFGPFLVHQGKFKSIPADDPEGVLTIGLNRAVDLLAQPNRGRGGAAVAAALRELGAHPDDGKAIGVYSGRYGAYVKHGNVNATLPKSMTPETVTKEQAIELIKARIEKDGGGKKKSSRKPAAPKTKKKATQE